MKWNSPYVLLLVATCLWGGNFVVGKTLVNEIPPLTLALIRWSIALLFMAPFFGEKVWQRREIYRQNWKMAVFLSLTGVAGFNTFVYIALQYTDSINASLMNAATPIMIVLLSMVFLRESFSRIRSLGIMISLVGVLWIIGHGSWTTIVSLSFNRGDLWMLLAVFLWAMYSIGVRKTAGSISASEMLFITVVLCVIVLIPCSIIELIVTKRVVNGSWQTLLGSFYIGIFASLVAYACWNKAVAMIGPSRCASFLNFIPLFSAIFATLFTGEYIQLYHVVGALLILSGVYVTTRKTTAKQAFKNQV
ncbi:MAG: DMT family transporter [Paenibacillaceae bacterium]